MIIAGLIMYLVCNDAEARGKCNGNQEIADAGYIMMMIGISIQGLLCFLFCCLACCVLAAKK